MPFTEKVVYERDKDMLLDKKDNILKPIKVMHLMESMLVRRKQRSFERILKDIKDKDYIYQEYYEVKPLKFVDMKKMIRRNLLTFPL